MLIILDFDKRIRINFNDLNRKKYDQLYIFGDYKAKVKNPD